MSRYTKRVSERWDDALSRVGWADFERRVGDYYASQGYRVEHSGTGSGFARTDGGVDLKLFRDGQFIVVQCKHWNALQVPHNPVHELIGVMHTAGATGAILVTSGEFTRAAIDSASRFPGITLVDGAAVRAMIGPVDEAALQATGLARVSSPAGGPFRRPAQVRQARRRDAAMFAVAIAATVASLFVYAHLVRKATLPPKHATPAAERSTTRATPWAAAPVAATSMPPAAATQTVGRAPERDSTPRTPEELKAWERANAESMKILEKTTPALQSP
ncbi:restriction endonuclease [Luteibacter aegosomatissinici]|uniref:restriction endonuclease n=1 Tax=Luteibacter aegosomatissinici TaxID=2911539 RepID=UPI001FFC193A|nr:restriction endonuclease [Luteibacter aegosomatissinici]UPG92541.1 restriction endonuclease [Luteibacter aegosomatissinici]